MFVEKNGRFKTASCLAAFLILFQPIACVKRVLVAQTAAPESAQPAPIPVDEPPPSAVFKKKAAAVALNSETPWMQTPQSLLNYWSPMPEETPQRVELNQYLAASCSFKTKPLKGFDHFLNGLWGVAKYALAVAAAVGTITATQHK